MLAQRVNHVFRGIVCGAIGGSVAGTLFGLVYTLLGFELAVLGVYTFTGFLAGGSVGSIVGGSVGLTLLTTRPILDRLCQGIGIALVTIISLILPYSVEAERGVRFLVAVIVGVLVGYIGGKVGSRSYHWLYE